MNSLGNGTQKELETWLVFSSSPSLLSLPPAPHSVLGGSSINSQTQASTVRNSTCREHYGALKLYLFTRILYSSLPLACILIACLQALAL